MVPPHLPNHDIINFLQQVATGGNPAVQAAPTPKAPHAAAPLVVPAVAAPVATAPVAAVATAPTTVPVPGQAQAAAPQTRLSAAPWHQTGNEGWGSNGAAPGQTFSKAAPVPPPPTSGTVPEKANAKEEDLAQALSSHLQNPSQAPSAELLQALARVAKMEDEVPKAEPSNSSKAPAFDSWEEKPPGPPVEMPPAEMPSRSFGAHQEPPPPPPDMPEPGRGGPGGGANYRGAALQQLTRSALTAAGSSPEAQAAAKAAVEHLVKSLREKPDGLGEDAGSPDGELSSHLDTRAVGTVAAGPETCTFQYDLTPNDDAEATFRNIRRRIELEMSDGCVVQICLQMVRRPR